MRVSRRPSPGQRRGVEFTRRPSVALEHEYLDKALEDAESAARWYAERSEAARGLLAITAPIDICYDVTRSASSIESKLAAFSSSQWLTVIVDRATGDRGSRRLANRGVLKGPDDNSGG